MKYSKLTLPLSLIILFSGLALAQAAQLTGGGGGNSDYSPTLSVSGSSTTSSVLGEYDRYTISGEMLAVTQSTSDAQTDRLYRFHITDEVSGETEPGTVRIRQYDAGLWHTGGESADFKEAKTGVVFNDFERDIDSGQYVTSINDMLENPYGSCPIVSAENCQVSKNSFRSGFSDKCSGRCSVGHIDDSGPDFSGTRGDIIMGEVFKPDEVDEIPDGTISSRDRMFHICDNTVSETQDRYVYSPGNEISEDYFVCDGYTWKPDDDASVLGSVALTGLCNRNNVGDTQTVDGQDYECARVSSGGQNAFDWREAISVGDDREDSNTDDEDDTSSETSYDISLSVDTSVKEINYGNTGWITATASSDKEEFEEDVSVRIREDIGAGHAVRDQIDCTQPGCEAEFDLPYEDLGEEGIRVSAVLEVNGEDIETEFFEFSQEELSENAISVEQAEQFGDNEWAALASIDPDFVSVPEINRPYEPREAVIMVRANSEDISGTGFFEDAAEYFNRLADFDERRLDRDLDGVSGPGQSYQAADTNYIVPEDTASPFESDGCYEGTGFTPIDYRSVSDSIEDPSRPPSWSGGNWEPDPYECPSWMSRVDWDLLPPSAGEGEVDTGSDDSTDESGSGEEDSSSSSDSERESIANDGIAAMSSDDERDIDDIPHEDVWYQYCSNDVGGFGDNINSEDLSECVSPCWGETGTAPDNENLECERLVESVCLDSTQYSYNSERNVCE